MEIITLTGVPREAVQFDFDGTRLTLSVAYSNRRGGWSLSLSDRTTDPPTPILSGVAIVVGVDIFKPYALGLGTLVAVAVERPGEDPGRGEMGGRVKLIYVPPAEVEALTA